MKRLIISIFFILTFNFISAQEISQLLKDGKYFFDNEYYTDAKESFTQVLNIDSLNFDALIFRGKSYLQLNINDSAGIDFSKAVKYYPLSDISYYNYGRFFHTTNNFKEAINNYKKAITFNQDSALYYLAIAQVYKDTDNQDSAFLFYNNALAIQPDYSDAYYYRAYYNFELGNFDEAYSDIDKGLEIISNDVYLLTLKAYLQSFDEDYEATLETCNLILSENPLFVPALEIRAESYFILDKLDEAVSDAEFIYMQDTSNLRAVIILSWSNYYLSDFNNCIYYAEKGKNLDTTNLDFYSLKGLALFYSENYSDAITEFDKAISLQPEKMDFYDYKIQSILLRNTPKNVFGENLIFNELNQNNLDLLDKMSNDEKSKYYYSVLFDKFTKDCTSLGLDEYFMLYFGQTLQKNYAPYVKSEMKKLMRDEFSIGKYEETIKIATELLEQDPFLIDAYQYLAYSYYYLYDYTNYQKYMLPYHGFMSGVMATGTGDSYENAYIIASVADEYSLLYFMGLYSREQSLMSQNGSYYDVLVAEDYYNNKEEVYFNIDKPYNSLSKIFKKPKFKLFRKKKS